MFMYTYMVLVTLYSTFNYVHGTPNNITYSHTVSDYASLCCVGTLSEPL